MKIKVTVLFVIACFIVGFAVAVLPTCSKSFEQGYEQGFERTFVESCSENASQGGLPESACQCLYTELRKKHSMADMTKWSLTDFPEEVTDEAALACNLQPK